MSLQIASLNSGSNGNCYYIGNDTDAIFVDVGLSCRETERRMQRLNLSMQKIKAIFISHEHIDHVRGLAGIATKYNLPIYVTHKTKAGCYHLTDHNTIHFNANEPVNIGTLSIVGFSKLHDAADAHSFNITSNGITVGVFTDIGTVCDNLIHHFKQCHAAFLEANYDDEMLENGRYPVFLKDRIRGTHGHLSNEQALKLFENHRPKFMTQLLLAHLSKDNNSVQLVQDLFSVIDRNVEVVVASRYGESLVYSIGEINNNNTLVNKTEGKVFYQATLF